MWRVDSNPRSVTGLATCIGEEHNAGDPGRTRTNPKRARAATRSPARRLDAILSPSVIGRGAARKAQPRVSGPVRAGGVGSLIPARGLASAGRRRCHRPAARRRSPPNRLRAQARCTHPRESDGARPPGRGGRHRSGVGLHARGEAGVRNDRAVDHGRLDDGRPLWTRLGKLLPEPIRDPHWPEGPFRLARAIAGDRDLREATGRPRRRCGEGEKAGRGAGRRDERVLGGQCGASLW